MRFNPMLISSFLLVSAVLADRGGENQSRLAERDQHFIYAKHWTGSVLESHMLEQASFRDVGGTFIVPTPSPAGDSDSDAAAGVSVWVGFGGGGKFDRLDGANNGPTCVSDNIIQVGVSLNVTKEGTISCTPWFTWYPSTWGVIPDISVNPGDEVRIAAGVMVLGPDLLNGTFFIDNFTTKERFSLGIKAIYPPCTDYAEWVVEDYMVDNVYIPFANFTPITFTNAVANAGDTQYGPENGTIARMGQDSASVTWTDVDTMTIQRGLLDPY